MNYLNLAKRYLELFYSGENIEQLSEIFADDLEFCGPFIHAISADEYITALLENPPEDMGYEILKEYSDDDSVCIVYELRKETVTTLMVQIFEFAGGKISKIRLVFNAKDFE